MVWRGATAQYLSITEDTQRGMIILLSNASSNCQKFARTFFDFKPNFDKCAVFHSRILQYLLSKGYVSSNRRHSERDDNSAKPRKHKWLNSAWIFFDFEPNFDKCAVFYSRIVQYLLSKGSSKRRHSERDDNFAKPRKHIRWTKKNQPFAVGFLFEHWENWHRWTSGGCKKFSHFKPT